MRKHACLEMILRRIAFLTAGLIVISCATRQDDEAFARSFIERLIANDSAGASQFAPSALKAVGSWQGAVAVLKKGLPEAPIDSVTFYVREIGIGPEGRDHKITNRVFADSVYSVVELDLVSGARGQLLISACKTRGPFPLSSAHSH